MANTAKPRSSSTSTTGPRGVSIATAVSSGRAPVFSSSQQHSSSRPAPPCVSMRNIALGHALTLGVEQAGAMLLHCPIEADKPTNLVFHRFHLQSKASHRDVRRSLYWRSRRKPPTGRRRGLSAGAQVLLRCSWHGVGNGGSRQIGPFSQSNADWLFERQNGTGWAKARAKIPPTRFRAAASTRGHGAQSR